MYAWHDTPWMWQTMIVFWVLIAVAVYCVLSGPRGPTLARRGPRAVEILDERYARGELSAEEYHERRRTLQPPRAIEVSGAAGALFEEWGSPGDLTAMTARGTPAARGHFDVVRIYNRRVV